MATLGKNLSYDPLDFDPDKLSQGGKLQEYAIPIVAVLIFILILAFFSIPSINKLFEAYDEKALAEAELNSTKAELQDLQNLRNMNEANKETLERLQTIIPTSQTEVVNFVNKVEQVSTETSVQFNDPVAGERIIVESSGVNSAAVNNERNLRLIQIPVTFNLVGGLSNLRSLLSSIYSSNDFIVMTEMELDNRSIEADGSSMELELSKYQYNPPISEEDYELLLDQISFRERPDQDVIDFIRRKTDISQ